MRDISDIYQPEADNYLCFGHRNSFTGHMCIQGPKIKKNLIYSRRAQALQTATKTFHCTHFSSCYPPTVRKDFIKGECAYYVCKLRCMGQITK